jgi:hypothetical protein
MVFGWLVGFWGFWQIETETVPKRFLAVRKVFGLTETEAVSEGFWRLGVFGGFWQLGVFGGFWGFWPEIWQKCLKIGCFWQ